MRDRKHFTKEFKLEAVRLLHDGGQPASTVARQLGIRRNQLYKWREAVAAYGPDAAFDRGPGRPRADQEGEVVRLRRALARVTEERDILKKAAAYFARDLG